MGCGLPQVRGAEERAALAEEARRIAEHEAVMASEMADKAEAERTEKLEVTCPSAHTKPACSGHPHCILLTSSMLSLSVSVCVCVPSASLSLSLSPSLSLSSQCGSMARVCGVLPSTGRVGVHQGVEAGRLCTPAGDQADKAAAERA